MLDWDRSSPEQLKKEILMQKRTKCFLNSEKYNMKKYFFLLCFVVHKRSIMFYKLNIITNTNHFAFLLGGRKSRVGGNGARFL
jgi:hypothetical protein